MHDKKINVNSGCVGIKVISEIVQSQCLEIACINGQAVNVPEEHNIARECRVETFVHCLFKIGRIERFGGNQTETKMIDKDMNG